MHHRSLPLAVAFVVAAALTTAQRPAAFPEGGATITHLLMHYSGANESGWLPVYAGLSRALPSDVRLTVAVDDEERPALDQRLREHHLRLPEILEVDGPITPWARDRLLALGGQSSISLVTPYAGELTDAYAGDVVAADALSDRLELVGASTRLVFEGGNIICSAVHAFVGHGTIRNNVELGTEAAVRRRFSRLLQVPVTVVGARLGPPHEHVDMYLTALDARTVALGSPSLGADLLRTCTTPPPGFDDWAEEVQRQVEPSYEAIRCDLEKLGVRVVRLPVLHGMEGGMLTWNNGLVERRDGQTLVYLPSYGADALDHAARAILEGCGCRVFPIDVAEIAADGGTVRCLTNVISWRPATIGREGS